MSIRNWPGHRFRHLVLASVVLAAACGGGDGGGGETRRFDQYPTLLAIEGSGVIESGRQATLHVVADIDFSRNANISLDETLGVDVSAAVPVTPVRPILHQERDTYLAAVWATAPSVGAVTRYELQARNPRTTVTREIFVVPAGTLYVKSIDTAGNVVVAGGSVQATLVLSALVPEGASVQVALASSSAQVTVPATVTVPALSCCVSFPISGEAIQGEQYVRISATLNGATQSIGLWLRSATPFLRHLAVPGHLASNPSAPVTDTGTAYLSSPAPAGTLLSLASNNTLVQVPATIPVDSGSASVQVPISVSPFGDFTAVRFTASYGGVEKVADATVGFRTGDARLEGLRVDGESGFQAGARLHGSCSFPLLVDAYAHTDSSSRIAFVDLTLSDPAPADARIEVFSSKRLAAEAYAEVIVPAGQKSLSFQLAVEPGSLIGDELRWLRLKARVKSTGQELSEPIVAFTWAADFVAVDIESVVPSDLVAFAGTNARFEISLTRAHRFDDFPVRLSLHEVSSGNELAFVDTTVFAGASSRTVSLPMPVVAQSTLVEVRATQGSPRSDSLWCGIADTARARSIPFPVLPAQTGLLSITPAAQGLFAGQSTDVTVRLGGPATADARITVASTLPAAVLTGVPAELVIPAGGSTASFTVTAAANVTAISSGTLSASLNGATRTAAMHVLAEPNSVQLVLTPASVTSGQAVSVRVDLSPIYPLPMDVLLSSDRAALPVPGALRVAANEASAATTVIAGMVTVAETVSVTARVRGLNAAQAIVVVPPAATGWRLLSAALASSLVADLSSTVALDATGQAFVGYIQNVGEQGRLTVRREGGGFVPLATLNANASWSATSLDMAIDAAGQPVVAYGIDLDSVAAWRWNDTVQQSRTESNRLNLTPNAGKSPQIGLAGGEANLQVIVAAWVENDQIALRRYSMATQSWDAGAFIGGIANVRSIRMVLDASGAPVIAYWSGTLNVIRETAPGAWTALGGAINSEPTDFNGAASFGVHVDAGDAVRVVWVEGIRGASWSVYARRFDGATWVTADPVLGTEGLIAQSGPSSGLEFPESIVVARNPSAFAFATGWEETQTGFSRLRLWRQINGTMNTETIPTVQTGGYLRARRISLAMQDADRPVVTSSHYEPTGSPPYALQVRRYVP